MSHGSGSEISVLLSAGTVRSAKQRWSQSIGNVGKMLFAGSVNASVDLKNRATASHVRDACDTWDEN